jgi:hypothetical protein
MFTPSGGKKTLLQRKQPLVVVCGVVVMRWGNVF